MAELDRIKPNNWDAYSPTVTPGVPSPYDVVDWPSVAYLPDDTRSLMASGMPQILQQAMRQPALWADEGYFHDGLPIAGTELPPTVEGTN